jgi:hypothetical protein
MLPTNESGRILWLGWGDLARKCEPAIGEMKQAGYKIYALDVRERPTALLNGVEPSELFVRNRSSHHDNLLRVASQHGFDAIYVANPGHFHISSAIEFQHFAPVVLLSKPLDTHLGFLMTLAENKENYVHLLPKLFVHDHYLNKPAVEFLATKLMPRLHQRHNFLANVVMFLVERGSIETHEKSRIPGLNCGMLFDLAVHMISILDRIAPPTIKWTSGSGLYERTWREVEVVACQTARHGGSLLGKSTVLHGREAESFGIIELKVTEGIRHEGSEVPPQSFRVLIVVGKGVPYEHGATRDLKTIQLNFKDEAAVTLDVDTGQFSGVDTSELNALGYNRMDLTQRGINKPLIEAATAKFTAKVKTRLFQPYSPALQSVELLSRALYAAPVKPVGYNESTSSCRDLTNALLRRDSRFSDWQLPGNFISFLVGAPPTRTTA